MNKKIFFTLFALLSLESKGSLVRTLLCKPARAFSSRLTDNQIRSITHAEAFLDRWVDLLRIIEIDLYVILGWRLTLGTIKFPDDLSSPEREADHTKALLAGKKWLSKHFDKNPETSEQVRVFMMNVFDRVKYLYLETIKAEYLSQEEIKAGRLWEGIYNKSVVECARDIVALVENTTVSVPVHPYIIEK